MRSIGLPSVGDWYTLPVTDGRFAAVRIGAVSRTTPGVLIGWFFGPFDLPPATEELRRCERDHAVWRVCFHGLEGDTGAWEKAAGGGADDAPWPVESFGHGDEDGPWWRLNLDPEEPGRETGRDPIDRETFESLPSGGVLVTGRTLELLLPYVFQDPVRFKRLAVASRLRDEQDRWQREARQASSEDSLPVHARFYLYFEDLEAAEDAARRVLRLGLRAKLSPSATEGLTLLLGDGYLDPDAEFNSMVKALEQIAGECGGEYDGHERAVHP